MSLKLKLDDGVFKVDLRPWEKYIDWSPGLPYFNLNPGISPYKLIAYLSRQLPAGSLVTDCGTLYGCSSAAMASDSFSSIHTWDITDHIQTHSLNVDGLPNVWRHMSSCLEGVSIPAPWSIEKSLLIYLDIDPHDGKQEVEMLEKLESHNFHGIMVCDDIHLNPEMEKFWDGIRNTEWDCEPAYKTFDVSRWGHHAGTGAIVFDPNVIDLEVLL